MSLNLLLGQEQIPSQIRRHLGVMKFIESYITSISSNDMVRVICYDMLDDTPS